MQWMAQVRDARRRGVPEARIEEALFRAGFGSPQPGTTDRPRPGTALSHLQEAYTALGAADEDAPGRSALGGFGDALLQLAQGLTGGTVDDLVGGMAAAGSPGQVPATVAPASERAAAAAAPVRARDEAFRADFPELASGLRVTGALGSAALGVGAMAPSTLPRTMAAGAGTSAGMGILTRFGEDGDPVDPLSVGLDVLMGAGTPVLAGIAGRAVDRGYRSLLDRLGAGAGTRAEAGGLAQDIANRTRRGDRPQTMRGEVEDIWSPAPIETATQGAAVRAAKGTVDRMRQDVYAPLERVRVRPSSRFDAIVNRPEFRDAWQTALRNAGAPSVALGARGAPTPTVAALQEFRDVLRGVRDPIATFGMSRKSLNKIINGDLSAAYDEMVPGFRAADRQYAQVQTITDAARRGGRARTGSALPSEIERELAEVRNAAGPYATEAADAYRRGYLDRIVRQLQSGTADANAIARYRRTLRTFYPDMPSFINQLEQATAASGVVGRTSLDVTALARMLRPQDDANPLDQLDAAAPTPPSSMVAPPPAQPSTAGVNLPPLSELRAGLNPSDAPPPPPRSDGAPVARRGDLDFQRWYQHRYDSRNAPLFADAPPAEAGPPPPTTLPAMAAADAAGGYARPRVDPRGRPLLGPAVASQAPRDPREPPALAAARPEGTFDELLAMENRPGGVMPWTGSYEDLALSNPVGREVRGALGRVPGIRMVVNPINSFLLGQESPFALPGGEENRGEGIVNMVAEALGLADAARALPALAAAAMPAFLRAPGVRRLFHYSRVPDLTTVDPKFMGSGTGLGVEQYTRRYGSRMMPIAFAYGEDVVPEAGLRSARRYQIEVPEDRIADISQMPEILDMARTGEDFGPVLKSRGYAAWTNSAGERPGWYALLEPREVAPEIALTREADETASRARATMRQGRTDVPPEEVPAMLTPAERRAPNPEIRAVEDRFAPDAPDVAPIEAVDEDFHRRVAQAYDELESTPDDPEVRAAYEAFNREIEEQYQALVDAGYRMEPTPDDPYPDSAAMMDDVRRNRRLRVYSGGEPHPMMTPEQTQKFRFVHDMIAHAGRGNQFGPRGEELAFRTHARTLSAAARRALATETRGQNSWVNFFGDHGSRPVRERPYAVQKAALLPEEFSRLDYRPIEDVLAERAMAMPDGFTLNPRTGEPIAEGFAVGLGRRGAKKATIAPPLRPEAIRRIFEENRELFAQHPDIALGGWFNARTGMYEIEPSRVLRGREDAIRAGREYDEEKIGDLAAYSRGDDGDIDLAAAADPRFNIGSGRFASRLERAVEGARMTRGSGREWEAYLQKQPFRREEFEETLLPWLRENADRKLSRDDVLAATRERTPRLTETVLPTEDGARAAATRARMEAERSRAFDRREAARLALRRFEEDTGLALPQPELARGGLPRELLGRDYTDLPIAGRQELDELAAEYAAAARAENELQRQRLPGGPGRTRYDAYKEPGGEDYHEIVVQLDEAGDESEMYAVFAGDYQTPGFYRDRALAEENARGFEQGTVRAVRNTMWPTAKTFRSNHWDVDNPLLHVRATIRRGPNGEKVYYVEEIQSDWHQAGRDKGYRRVDTPFSWTEVSVATPSGIRATGYRRMFQTDEDIAGAPFVMFERNDGQWEFGGSIYDTRDGAEQAARAAAQHRNINRGVPNAPFKRTEDWAGLAWRRIVDEAIKRGATRIAWTPGAVQARRYDLAQHVRRIEYDPVHKQLRAYEREIEDAYSSDVPVFEQDDVSPERLVELIGKDAADRLTRTRPHAGVHVLEGSGLTVEEGGMSAFYDEMMPRVVRDWAKKHGLDIRPGRLGEVPAAHKPGTLSARSAGRDAALTGAHYIDLPERARTRLRNAGQLLPAVAGASVGAAAAGGNPEDGYLDEAGVTAIVGGALVGAALKGKKIKLRGLLTPAEWKTARAGRRTFVEAVRALPPDRELRAAALAGQIRRNWYTNSAYAISEVFGPDTPRFAAFLAALSPQTPVQRNLEMAVELWQRWHKAGRPLRGSAWDDLERRVAAIGVVGDGYLPNVRTALRAALGNSNPTEAVLRLSGSKVDSFMRNLLHDADRVTLDSWMARLAGQNPKSTFLKSGRAPLYTMGGGYTAYSAQVRRVAKQLTARTGVKWTPAEVQAAAWSWAQPFGEGRSKLPVDWMDAPQKIITLDQLEEVPDFATLLRPLARDEGLTLPTLREPAPHTGVEPPRGPLANAGRNILSTYGEAPAPLARVPKSRPVIAATSAPSPRGRVRELEGKYGSEEALGVTYDEHEEMYLLPNEGDAGRCTECAAYVVEKEGRGRVIGYADGTNPSQHATGDSPGSGHDFAVIDERYIVDPWVVAHGTSKRGVFDLQDPDDAGAIRRLYGDPATWEEMDYRRGEGLRDGIEHLRPKRRRRKAG